MIFDNKSNKTETTTTKNTDTKKKIVSCNTEKNPEVSEYTLRKQGLYSFEYEVMPLYVEFLENNPDAEYILIDSSIWKKDIATFSQTKYIEWDEISCEIIGDMNSEFVILYEFPKPFDIPLAKYGAVYINKQSHIYNYYTLEKSYHGYILCSLSTKIHSNYGERNDMSKEDFIKELCNIIGTDDISQRSWRLAKDKISMDKSRYYEEQLNNMAELNDCGLEKITDRNFNETITDNARVVICFYDRVIIQDKQLTSKLCQVMLPALSSLADEFRGKVKVCIYDVYSSENETARTTYNIKAVPTLLFIKNGETIKKRIGICMNEDMKTLFEELLSE